MIKNSKTIIIGINLGDFGSTGSIMRNSLEYAHDHANFDFLIIVPSSNLENTYSFKKRFTLFENIVFLKLLKLNQRLPDGFYYRFNTKRIIKKIEEKRREYKKVIIHIHNIHHSEFSFTGLFSYIRRKNIDVILTLHDEWMLTGGCFLPQLSSCSMWKKCCNCKCAQQLDRKIIKVKEVYKVKMKSITRIKTDKLVVVGVSKWLCNMIKESYFSKYPIVLNYGECSIVPKPFDSKKLLNSLIIPESNYIILSVSYWWADNKGSLFLNEIAKKLPSNYTYIVIGKGLEGNKLDEKIINIPFVTNDELHEYYSISDVYVSVSKCESLGLTTCEAQICGTPVVCFDNSAIKETITTKSGISVENMNISALIQSIVYICNNHPFKEDDIIKSGKRFQKNEHAKRMIEIYKAIEAK